MAAVAGEEDTQRSRRGDGRHDSQLRSLRLQQRPLLYVQLHERRHRSFRDQRPVQYLLYLGGTPAVIPLSDDFSTLY